MTMDSLRTLDLLVGSLAVMPHELNLGWTLLTDVILRGSFYPDVLDGVMDSLRDVTQLKWSGDLKLAEENHNKYRYQLNFLKYVSVCSNEDGCSFFIRSLDSECVETVHLSHFPRNCKGHGLSAVENLFIENEISPDQFLATIHHFPTLVNADFKIGGFTATEQSEWITMQQKIASLTLRGVSASIRQLFTTPN